MSAMIYAIGHSQALFYLPYLTELDDFTLCQGQPALPASDSRVFIKQLLDNALFTNVFCVDINQPGRFWSFIYTPMYVFLKWLQGMTRLATIFLGGHGAAGAYFALPWEL